MTSDAFIKFLKELHIHMQGKKLLLFVDGLASHKSKIVKAYIHTQKSWLRIERLPSYAPECNPIEYLWGSMKKKHLGNARVIGMGPLVGMIKKAHVRMNDTKLLGGFLKRSELWS